jgi:CRISPR type IV-associated protein Csf3
VIFYARADLEILEDLLKDLIGLGDNWRVGWGAVRKFVIEEWEEDWSIVADGRAMRPIPVRFLKSYEDSALLAWRSPYWDLSNVEECAVPGTRVELKDE